MFSCSVEAVESDHSIIMNCRLAQLSIKRDYTNNRAPAGRGSPELAINSPSKLGISEGILCVLERGKAR